MGSYVGRTARAVAGSLVRHVALAAWFVAAGFPLAEIARAQVGPPAAPGGAASAEPQAQLPPQLKAKDLGFVLDASKLKKLAPRGEPQRVVVKDPENNTVVAKVHCEVGDTLVVILPNGHLHQVPTREATPTYRPYEPATKDALTKALERQFPKFKVRSTKRFLYCYNSSDTFYQGTSRILETMYPNLYAFFERNKFPVHDPDTLLVVIMFRTEKEFQAFRPMPPGVAAYYDVIANHVVMYEQSDLSNVAPDLAVKLAVSVVAHEGVHQVLHNIGVQQRLSEWPMWISEGLPEYFAPTSVDKGVRWKGVGLVNDMRMLEMDRYATATLTKVRPGETLQAVIEGDNLTSTGYAFAWGLTHYLAERRKADFIEYLRDVSRLGPLEAAAEKVVDRVPLRGPPIPGQSTFQTRTRQPDPFYEQRFGGDYVAVETDLVAHLKKQRWVDPFETLPYFVGMLEASDATNAYREAVVTFSPVAIEEWQQEVGDRLRRSLGTGVTIRFNIRQFPNRTLARAFATQFLSN